MKNILFGIAAILFCCQCTNGDDIGDLYGRWKLESFSCPVNTARPDTVFIGFQGQAYSYQPNWTYNWGIYIRNDKELFLGKLQYGGSLKALFLEEESALFNIEYLSRKKMILTRNDSVWVFNKYL